MPQGIDSVLYGMALWRIWASPWRNSATTGSAPQVIPNIIHTENINYQLATVYHFMAIFSILFLAIYNLS